MTTKVNEINKIEYDVVHDDLTVYLVGSHEPWVMSEFGKCSKTRINLELLRSEIRDLISDFNKISRLKTTDAVFILESLTTNNAKKRITKIVDKWKRMK